MQCWLQKYILQNEQKIHISPYFVPTKRFFFIFFGYVSLCSMSLKRLGALETTKITNFRKREKMNIFARNCVSF